jgi:hypothetical protein
MGTTTAVGQTSTELVLKQMVTLLAPEGDYEKRKIALKNEYAPIVASAAKITTITTEEEAQEAANHGRLLQAGGREIETFFKSIKTKCDAVKNPILADEKIANKPLDDEKKRLGVLVGKWNQEVERKRQEAQRIADEEALKQAQEDALQRAIELAASGEDEASEAALNEPIVAAPVVIAAPVSRPTGSVGRKYYKCKVNDFKALVAAVAAGTVPLLALDPNQSFLNDQADTFKEAFSYPGCALDTTTSTSFRA